MNSVKINDHFYYSLDEIKQLGINYTNNEIIFAKKINNIWVKMEKELGKKYKKFVPINYTNFQDTLPDICNNAKDDVQIRLKGERKLDKLYFHIGDILFKLCNQDLNNILIKTELKIDFVMVDCEYFMNYNSLLKVLIKYNYPFLTKISDWVYSIIEKDDDKIRTLETELEYTKRIKELELENMKLQLELIKTTLIQSRKNKL